MPKKREVAPENHNGCIRLRFSVEGTRFSFHPLPGGKWENKKHRQICEAIATKIGFDILAGNFDPTLTRYKHQAIPESAAQPLPKKSQSAQRWLEIWNSYIQSLSLKPEAQADHYEMVRRQIVKAGNPSLEEIDWLLNSKLAASTFNRRLGMLRSAVEKAIAQGKIKSDPLANIKNRLATLEEEEATEAKKAPFNAEEVSKIIKYFQEHHSSYAPFVEFLLYSGVRTGEAVGLRWKDIDLDKCVIQVQQAITRERGKYKKVRKRPKTLQSVRSLKMSHRAYELFSRIRPEQPLPDDLIFKSPKGCIIDHGNFRVNYWKPALKKLGIAYRKPYATRHTLLSEALESGLTIPQVAAIAGHKDGRMILQHYGRQINQPQLPE